MISRLRRRAHCVSSVVVVKTRSQKHCPDPMLERRLWRELRRLTEGTILKTNDDRETTDLHALGLIEWVRGWRLTELGQVSLRTGRITK